MLKGSNHLLRLLVVLVSIFNLDFVVPCPLHDLNFTDSAADGVYGGNQTVRLELYQSFVCLHDAVVPRFWRRINITGRRPSPDSWVGRDIGVARDVGIQRRA